MPKTMSRPSTTSASLSHIDLEVVAGGNEPPSGSGPRPEPRPRPRPGSEGSVERPFGGPVPRAFGESDFDDDDSFGWNVGANETAMNNDQWGGFRDQPRAWDDDSSNATLDGGWRSTSLDYEEEPRNDSFDV